MAGPRDMKVRGKRRSGQPTTVNSSDLPASTLRLPGRMKHSSQLSSSVKKARKTPENLAKQKQKAMMSIQIQEKSRLSPFESLPVELLEQIFLESLEVNMARASPFLSKTLSNPSIYNSLLLFAFFEDRQLEPVEMYHFRPGRYRRLSETEQLNLQVSIMKCRWCNLQTIEMCLPALKRLRIFQAWHEEKKDEEIHLDLRNRVNLYGGDPVFLERNDLPDINDHLGLETYFSIPNVSEVRGYSKLLDDDLAKLAVLRREAYHKPGQPRSEVYKTIDDLESTLCVRHIPNHLLNGSPWPPENMKYLQFLIEGRSFSQGRGYVQVRQPLNLSYSTLHRGIANAIQEKRLDVVETLMDLHAKASDEEEICSRLLDVDEEEIKAVVRSQALPVEVLHLCAAGGSDSSKLMRIILRWGPKNIASLKEDPIITRWALENRDAGGRVGKWMLDYMAGTTRVWFRDLPSINGRRRS